MTWNRRCSLGTASAVAAVAIFFVYHVESSTALELSIIERGSGDDTEIGLWARDFGDRPLRTISLTSPSGDQFQPASVLEDGFLSDLLFRFDSLSEAFTFVSGTWVGAQMGPFSSSPVEEFEFSINAVPIDAIHRTVPTLASPSPGQKIKNGSTFEFGWDYLTSGEAPNRSRYTVIPQFDPVSSGGASVVSTPRPGTSSSGTGSTGSGDRKFTRTRTNVPDADKNRFLSTFEVTPAALPLDVALTLGSYTDLAAFVVPSNSVGFFYSREVDPFFVTLTVPEPRSLGMFGATSCCGCLLRRRVRIFSN
jgi:hypothetical protein